MVQSNTEQAAKVSSQDGAEVAASKKLRIAINCKWCGMGHRPEKSGSHFIVKSISPARIDIKECAYHKAGEASPIVKT